MIDAGPRATSSGRTTLPRLAKPTSPASVPRKRAATTPYRAWARHGQRRCAIAPARSPPCDSAQRAAPTGVQDGARRGLAWRSHAVQPVARGPDSGESPASMARELMRSAGRGLERTARIGGTGQTTSGPTLRRCLNRPDLDGHCLGSESRPLDAIAERECQLYFPHVRRSVE